MALKNQPALGKALYGGLFVIILPAALIGWAHGARVNVGLPAIRSVPWGIALVSAGFLLWISGVVALRVRGGGLPMNAFPPPKLVTGGIYAVTAHPIYAGFILIFAGGAIACGSAAGLWLVTPVLAVAAAALWWGYERIDLYARLGIPCRAAWLGVPLNSSDTPRTPERIGSFVMTLIAPALAALMLHHAELAGEPSYIRAESAVRVCAALALALTGVSAARTCRDLRNAVLTSWAGSLWIVVFALILPGGPYGGRVPFAPDGALLALVAMAGLDSLLFAVPKPPGIVRIGLSLVAGLFLVGRGTIPSAESLLGAIAFTLGRARWHLWKGALRLCGRIANCWRESEFGPVRIIHIGWFAALPAFTATACAVCLAGPGTAAITLWAIVFIIIGSALWAQLIEGSPALSRPYGFFGGVLGLVFVALLIAPLAFDISPWLVLATFATVAPWAQGLARLRCLANGCCHGAPCGESFGVVYRNSHTRVVRLANLGGVPIHPTPLYSLAGNVLIGALMIRLWAEGASLALITGLYFVLMGLARFVEEAWRGEPQTPSYAGLRLYQWVSIGSLAAGAALSVVPGSPHAPAPEPGFAALWTGLTAGSLTWLAASVDFPRSSGRFARLA